MASKRQFLDPIGAGCKLILLYFTDPNTKIRIDDHTIQLVADSLGERLLLRPWIYGDSRHDICVLYPVIVRFIELYLIEKKNKKNTMSDMNGLQLFNLGNDDEKNKQLDKLEYSDKCYECLEKMASYIILGISRLEETYGYDNAVFSLQFFSNLLRAGINGTYSSDLLPTHLKDSTTHNLLDITKIKGLWKDTDIIDITGLFEKCFEAYTNNDMYKINAFKAGIIEMLNMHDEQFKNIIASTDSA